MYSSTVANYHCTGLLVLLLVVDSIVVGISKFFNDLGVNEGKLPLYSEGFSSALIIRLLPPPLNNNTYNHNDSNFTEQNFSFGARIVPYRSYILPNLNIIR